VVTARHERRRRRLLLAPEPERYEICEVARGRAPKRVRVLATADTLAGARLALRTLCEEGEARPGSLAIRDSATGRRVV
jgi:hypothetical protein